jgi:glycosyltransferase involved in cell wall biosynthesis
MKPEISIVIPIFNEEESVQELVARINEALRKTKHAFEIVFIDDGSDDGTLELLKKYARDFKNIHVYSFRRNMGKAVALSLGFQKAKGEYVVTMDADLQDDPENIEKMLISIKSGNYDLISGWRKNRHDSKLKIANSRFFNNIVIPLMFKVKFNDMNSGLKLYKSELSREIKIYGGMHRFIPVLVHEMGYRVKEVDIIHHSRKYGTSKFKSTKVFTDIPDLITMYFLVKYNHRPLHFFSKLGGVLLFSGTVILLYLVVIKLLGNPIGQRPLLTFGVLFVIAGIQTMFTGLLADLMVNFHRSDEKDELPIRYQSS